MIPILKNLITNEVFVLSGIAATATGWESVGDAPDWLLVLGTVCAAWLAGRGAVGNAGQSDVTSR